MTTTRLKRMPDVVTVVGRDGERSNLISEGLLKCRCNHCGVVFYLKSDLANHCPCCGRHGSDSIEKVWTRPQTILVPEGESPAFSAKDER
jgi:hypothetical protein